LLIFTNSARVWRANTRGDFWVLDLTAKTLKKLGGVSARPSTLQFAKFSPDGRHVGYVREHDLYVEPVGAGPIVALTHDGSTTWMKIAGDPRNNYLARMDWAANSTELAVQQLHRRQTVNTLYFTNVTTGAVRPVIVERDSAWIDIYDDHVDWGPGPSLHWTPD